MKTLKERCFHIVVVEFLFRIVYFLLLRCLLHKLRKVLENRFSSILMFFTISITENYYIHMIQRS